MKTKLYVVLGILVIILSYGFRKNNIANTEKKYLPISKDLKITGSQLFQNNCAACHGSNRQGNPPTFPSLVDVDKKLSKIQIAQLLKTGRNIMPNFSYLSSSERNAIIDFLYGESTESTITTEITAVENGRNLFVANCARCHQPDTKNLNSQNQMHNQNQMQMGMGMGMGMRPPVLNGVNKRLNIYQFKQILNMGPCYMPSFVAMDDANKEDIYSYLSSLEVNFQNNYRMRRGCGM